MEYSENENRGAIRKLLEARQIENLKHLIEKYGEFNLHCVYMDNNWTLRYGAIINVDSKDGKDVVQISMCPAPRKDMTVTLAQHNDFVGINNLLDVYKPICITDKLLSADGGGTGSDEGGIDDRTRYMIEKGIEANVPYFSCSSSSAEANEKNKY